MNSNSPPILQYIDFKDIKTRYIAVILIFSILAFFVHMFSYSKYYKTEKGLAAINKIPLHVNGWHGKDFPTEKIVYEILQTKSILSRRYISDSGHAVFLSIVYYPETKVDFHAPEGCLAGQGVKIVQSKDTLTFQDSKKSYQIEMKRLLRKKSDQQSLIYYFYKAGDFMGLSYTKLRFKLALNKFISREKSAALIQVTIALNNRDIDKKSAILKKFLKDLMPYFLQYL